MPKSDRPKLSLQCDLQIEAAQRGIHALYWQELRAMQQFRDGSQAYIRTPSGVPQLPPASKSPAHLRFLLGEYASRLFEAEASLYPHDRNLPHWLKELQYRIELSIFERLGALEREAVKGKSLDFHGLSTHQKQDAIEEGIAAPLKIRLDSCKQNLSPASSEDKKRSLAKQRRVFVSPILSEKGWSILDWANASNVAHATAMDYLQGKTTPYASTRLKLAKPLGVTPEQFPR